MKKILVIEDNKSVRENICEILILENYIAIEAENGRVGIEKMLSIKPDLILCDIMMPVLDGFGVLRIINSYPDLIDIPFLFLTAKSEKSDFREAMGLGADDYITKPFEGKELLKVIDFRIKKSERLRNIPNTSDGLRQFYDEAKAEEGLKNLSENREIRNFQKKEIIFELGKHPQWLYFIVTGIVKIVTVNEFGKELIPRIHGPGDFFGSLPLISETTYKNSAIALENCELKLVPPEDFKILLFNNRDFASKFIKMLACFADHTEKTLIDLAYSSVRKKVANALIILRRKSENESILIMRDDLANIAAIRKETVIRTLSDFKSEGLINIVDGEIKIIDMDGLEKMPQ